MGSESYIEFLRRHYEKFSAGSAPYIFEGDEEAFASDEGIKLNKNQKTKFHTELMPQPVTGDIKNAKLIFCMLNPGYAENDINEEDRLRNQYLRQLKQEDAYFYGLRKDYEDYGIGNYWRKGTKKVTKRVKKDGTNVVTTDPALFNTNHKKYSIVPLIHKAYQGKNSIEDVYNMLSKVVADIELVPYHSIKGPSEGFVELLDSSRRAKRFLKEEILPNARKNGQLICILRSEDLWGINDEAVKEFGEDVININTVNVQSVTTNIYSTTKDENGDHPEQPFGMRIYKHLEMLSDGFTKPLAELD